MQHHLQKCWNGTGVILEQDRLLFHFEISMQPKKNHRILSVRNNGNTNCFATIVNTAELLFRCNFEFTVFYVQHTETYFQFDAMAWGVPQCTACYSWSSTRLGSRCALSWCCQGDVLTDCTISTTVTYLCVTCRDFSHWSKTVKMDYLLYWSEK